MLSPTVQPPSPGGASTTTSSVPPSPGAGPSVPGTSDGRSPGALSPLPSAALPSTTGFFGLPPQPTRATATTTTNDRDISHGSSCLVISSGPPGQRPQCTSARRRPMRRVSPAPGMVRWLCARDHSLGQARLGTVQEPGHGSGFRSRVRDRRVGAAHAAEIHCFSTVAGVHACATRRSWPLARGPGRRSAVRSRQSAAMPFIQGAATPSRIFFAKASTTSMSVQRRSFTYALTK
jgi:hypothetical protein